MEVWPMKNIYISILFIVILIGSIIPANASLIYHDFPPTPAYRYIGTPTGQISAKNYHYPLNVTGSGCVTVSGVNSTHTLTISGSGCGSASKQGTYNTTQANNVNINVSGSQLNFINGTNGQVNVVNSHGGKQVNITVGSTTPTGITSINSQGGPAITVQGGGSTTVTTTTNTITVTGKTYQNNTGQNLGTHGTGFYSGMSGSVLQFLSLIVKYPLSLASNSTNVILTFTAKFNNATCANDGKHFFNSFDNVTGNLVCGAVSGFLTNAVLSINSDTSAAQNIIGRNSITVNDDNAGNHYILCLNCLNKTQNVGHAQNSVGVLSTSANDIVKGRNFTGASPITVTKTNDTDVSIGCGTCITSAITGSHNGGHAQNSVGVLSTATATQIVGRNVTGSSPIVVTKTNNTDISISCPTCGSSSGITGSGKINRLGLWNTTTNTLNDTKNLKYDRANSNLQPESDLAASEGTNSSRFDHITSLNGNFTTTATNKLTSSTGGNITAIKDINFKRAKISGILLNATSQTSSYTDTANDDTVLINATHNNFTNTLPSNSVAGTGKLYYIQKIDWSKNFVIVKPTSGNIGGFNNWNLTNKGDTLLVENNGTNWIPLTYNLPSIQPIRNSTSNEWVSSWGITGTPTTFQTANNTLYAVPMRIDRPMKLSQVESEITTAATGTTAKCRMGLYTDSNGYPQNLIQNSDVSDFSSLGTGVTSKTFASNIILPPANYYNVMDCASGQVTGTITQDVETAAQTVANSNAATQTVTLTIGSNSNEVCFTMIGLQNGQTNHNNRITSVKIGTNAFTLAVNKTVTQGGANLYDSEIWYLVGPPTGSQTVTITPTLPASTYQMVYAVRCLYNVNSSPVGNTATNTGSTSPDKLVLTMGANTNAIFQEGGMMFGCTVSAGQAASTNGTQDYNGANGAGLLGGGAHNNTPNLSLPNTLTWTFTCSGSITAFTDTGIEIKASQVSGTLPIVRSIPNGNLEPILGMPSGMGSANSPTMWTVTQQLGLPTTTALPYNFPAGATLTTTNVPWVQFNPKG